MTSQIKLNATGLSGAWPTLATNTTLTHANDTWYDMRLIVSGDHAEVWWGPKGETLSRILETGNLQLTTNTLLLFKTLAGAYYRLDNIGFKTDDPESAAFTYGTGNQLASMTANGLTTTFTYDAHGRMSTRSVEIGGQTYTATYSWRFGDKLKQIVSNIPGETALLQYNYDGLGKRRVKIANGNTTWWRWGLEWEPVTQYNESDDDWEIEGFSRFFVPFGHAALGEADVSAAPSNAAYNYLAQDHLGTGRYSYNQAKAQIAATEHLPYGTRYEQTGAAPYHEFTGKPWDADSEMFHFPYRYYFSEAGRWVALDPAGLIDGPNLYGYAKAEPTNRIDLFGLHVCIDIRTGEWVCDKNPNCPEKSPCKHTRDGANEVLDCQACCEKKFKWAIFTSPTAAENTKKCCLIKCAEGGTGVDAPGYWRTCKKKVKK